MHRSYVVTDRQASRWPFVLQLAVPPGPGPIHLRHGKVGLKNVEMGVLSSGLFDSYHAYGLWCRASEDLILCIYLAFDREEGRYTHISWQQAIPHAHGTWLRHASSLRCDHRSSLMILAGATDNGFAEIIKDFEIAGLSSSRIFTYESGVASEYGLQFRDFSFGEILPFD